MTPSAFAAVVASFAACAAFFASSTCAFAWSTSVESRMSLLFASVTAGTSAIVISLSSPCKLPFVSSSFVAPSGNALTAFSASSFARFATFCNPVKFLASSGLMTPSAFAAVVASFAACAAFFASSTCAFA